MGCLFPLNVLAQALPDLGVAQATDVDNQPVASATTFAGGLSVNELAMLDENRTVLPWNFDPLNLVPFRPQVELQSIQHIDIYFS